MNRLSVSEFLEALSYQGELPIVARSASLAEVVRAMIKGHRRRIVYVVGSDGELQGAITLDNLKDVIFHHYLDGRVSGSLVVTEHIAELFAGEKAEDIMEAGVPVCREHDRLPDVLARMLELNLKDIPVIDPQGRVIADLDILAFLELWLDRGLDAFS
jgi:CBS domain-containing protein